MIINETLVTGSTSLTKVSGGAPAVLFAVRVGGTANLVGTIIIGDGSTTRETIPAASTPGTAREHYGALFPNGVSITLSNAGDAAIVIWGAA